MAFFLRKLITGNIYVDEPTSGKFSYVIADSVLVDHEEAHLVGDTTTKAEALDRWGLGSSQDNTGLDSVSSEVRAELKTIYDSDVWANFTAGEKDVFARWFIASQSEIDTLFTATEQEQNRRELARRTAEPYSPLNLSPISDGGFLETISRPSQITADQNDYNPAGLQHKALLILDFDASHSITGFESSSFSDGQYFGVMNKSSHNAAIKDMDVLSSPSNQMDLGGNQNINKKTIALFIYDGVDNIWRILNWT